MTATSFAALELIEPLQRALTEQGYTQPTPIQAQAIPYLLRGRDLFGIAQTGTGKTAAFTLPILDLLAGDPHPTVSKRPSALILTPTRELAAQIGDSIARYGRNVKVSHAVIFGGVGQQPQVQKLRRGVDIVVATPGRLLDLLQQRHIELDDVEVFVLDEADRMLDMGFIRDVRKVLERLPEDRQSLLFSATMPADIVKLAQAFLDDPVRVEVTPPASTVERIDQSVMMVEKNDKRHLLVKLLADPDIERTLVFTRTKHGADRVVKHLVKEGIDAAAIHGNKSQGARERALEGFRQGKLRVLVATDIAARGIDVQGVTHVINFDLPNIPESYVHRIGRTARAGREGVAISFCDLDERAFLLDIEKIIKQQVAVVEDHPFRSDTPFDRPAAKPAGGDGKRRSGKRKSGGGAKRTPGHQHRRRQQQQSSRSGR